MADTVLAARIAAADQMSGGHGILAVAEAALAAHRVFDRIWARTVPAVDAVGAIACKAGCGWCCHQHVAVLPAEAVAIARTIEGTKLAERFDVLALSILGKTNTQRKAEKRACAFLIDGACAIYEVRPSRCRATHSRDLDFCRVRYELGHSPANHRPAKPIPLEPALIGDQVLRGLGQALAAAGLDPTPGELTHALAALRRDPYLAEDYAKGRNFPAQAQAPEDTAPLA
jgi:hypothetical protein